MFRHIAGLCLCALLAIGVPARADTAMNQLPELSGYTLDGNSRSLPQDLAAPSTLLVVTSEAPSDAEANVWRSLANKIDADLPVLFLVLMDDRGPRARAFAAGRLRGEVTDLARRTETIAVFLDIADFYQATGFNGRSGITGLLVSENGAILNTISGDTTEEAQTELEPALIDDRTEPRLPTNSVSTVQTEAVLSSSLPPETQVADAPAASKLPAPLSPATRTERTRTETEPTFPSVKGYTLAGQRISIPSGLAAAGTRLYLLRRGVRASDIANQIAAISERQQDDDEWLVLVFMGKAPTPSKAIAAGLLRGEITDETLRQHIVPVFSELEMLEAEHRFALPALDEPICVTASGATCVANPLD